MMNVSVGKFSYCSNLITRTGSFILLFDNV